MAINNQVYDDEAAGWWDEDGLLYAMGTLLDPVRVPYFEQVLTDHPVSEQASLLDVGCGGGSLAEAFSRLGYRISGVDLSAPSIRAARRHARSQGMDIHYAVASGDDLPFADGSFDVVSCCEVLEHVERPGKVVQECARVLRGGGVFLFATPNRTWLTWLALVKLAQDWRLTAVSPPNMHLHAKFIRPGDLSWVCETAGLHVAHITGVFPEVSRSLELLWIPPALRLGLITHAAAARRIRLRQSNSLALAYMGHALKREPGYTKLVDQVYSW